MLPTASTFCKFAMLFAITIYGEVLQAEVFNGPTSLIDKSFDDLTVNGPADLRKVKAKTLNVNGPLTFSDLEVSGKMTVSGPTIGRHAELHDVDVKGPFNAKDIEMQAVEVSGPVSLKEFTINGNTIVHGPLIAHDGYFQDLIAGSKEGGDVVELNDVTIKNITITKGAKAEVVTLKGETDVFGNITFESGVGSLIQKGDDIDFDGEVIGGKAGFQDLSK